MWEGARLMSSCSVCEENSGPKKPRTLFDRIVITHYLFPCVTFGMSFLLSILIGAAPSSVMSSRVISTATKSG